jgi:hypothetical protein
VAATPWDKSSANGIRTLPSGFQKSLLHKEPRFLKAEVATLWSYCRICGQKGMTCPGPIIFLNCSGGPGDDPSQQKLDCGLRVSAIIRHSGGGKVESCLGMPARLACCAGFLRG